MAGYHGIVQKMDHADTALEISTESVLHRIRRKGLFLSLIYVLKIPYRLGQFGNGIGNFYGIHEYQDNTMVGDSARFSFL